MPAVPVTVPSVGESITEGILARWLKADGASVQAGEPLFELETDKASSDVPASSSGVLKIAVAEGETVAIGATVGTIDPAGTAGGVAGAAGRAGRIGCARQTASAAGPGRDCDQLSPAVRRLVAEQGVDLARVAATGPGGRVTKGDVLASTRVRRDRSRRRPRATCWRASSRRGRHSRCRPRRPHRRHPRLPAPRRSVAAGPRETRQRMSRLRQRIAQRLVEAQQTAAILTTFNEADMSRVIELRTRYKEPFQKKHGIALGFMSFFIKAAIEALKAFPAVNVPHRRQRDRLSALLRHRRGRQHRARPDGPGRPRRRPALVRRDRKSHRRLRGQGARGDDRGRRPPGRHLHDHQRRHLRLAPVDADPQPAAKRASSACTRSRSGPSSSTTRSSSAR